MFIATGFVLLLDCNNKRYVLSSSAKGGRYAQESAILTCTEEDRATLNRWIRSRTIEARLVDRAKIIMKCIQEQSVSQPSKGFKDKAEYCH